MNLQLAANNIRRHDENTGLWQDGRIWWVNCVALEAAWLPEIEQAELPFARRQRDMLLAAFLKAW